MGLSAHASSCPSLVRSRISAARLGIQWRARARCSPKLFFAPGIRAKVAFLSFWGAPGRRPS
eukprot:6253347-Pyramimonas_sp.AAC.1